MKMAVSRQREPLASPPKPPKECSIYHTRFSSMNDSAMLGSNSVGGGTRDGGTKRCAAGEPKRLRCVLSPFWPFVL
jgi:hypothetical protein